MSKAKLTLLRNQFEQHAITAYLVPLTDAFQGEYIPACAKRLEWLTGFTGSNGLAVILKDKAAFFTDGRYTLQAKLEVDLNEYEQFNIALTSPLEWLASHVGEGEGIGFDPWLFTKKVLQPYEKKGLTLTSCTPNLIDVIWHDKPDFPSAPATSHPIAFSGEESSAKRKKLANYLQEKQLDGILLTSPDSICWLLNIRGHDIPHTPFLLCYALVYSDASVDICVDAQKIPDDLRKHLGAKIRIISPNALENHLNSLLNKKIQIDPSQAPLWFFPLLGHYVEEDDPCQLWKACKNAEEVTGARAAHIRDGVALTQFLFWLDTHHDTETITEISAAEKLASFRSKNKYFQELSFDTISGFSSNGAIVHYRVSEKSNKQLKKDGIYLVDSGAQYLDGTTDVTRTVVIGNATDAQRNHFTRVLKGHIALAMTIFPEGTTGSQLDSIARYALWQAGLDYDHGTGHGVGSYLSVHEGPQRISKAANNVALKPGMIISNEPGYYKEGEYGIRIENLILVIEKPELSREEKKYFGFETLTQAPIDMRLVNPIMLTDTEKDWLYQYHHTLRMLLAPHITNDMAQWLESYTTL